MSARRTTDLDIFAMVVWAIEHNSLETPWDLDYYIDALLVDGPDAADELVNWLKDEAQSFSESGMQAAADRALKVAELVRERGQS